MMVAFEGMDRQKAVEAVLFSVGKKIPAREVARLVGCSEGEAVMHLTALGEEYQQRDSPLVVLNEGTAWKMTVREKYIGIAQALIPETELTKSVLETLAVIAWKAPILQSEIVEMRSTKAYEHISLLEEQGFVTKERSGRSFKLTLSRKFYDYFDLRGPEEVKERFNQYGSIKGLVALFNRGAEKKEGEAAASAEQPAGEQAPAEEEKEEENIQDSE